MPFPGEEAARIHIKKNYPGDFPDPGIEPRSPALQADTLLSEPPGKPNAGTCIDAILEAQDFLLEPEGAFLVWSPGQACGVVHPGCKDATGLHPLCL